MQNKNQKIFIIGLLVLFLIVVLYSNYKKEEPVVNEMKIVPPQFVYNVLNNKDKKVLLVNTLSDNEKMRYRITVNGENDERSISKQQFEDLLLQNNNTIPKDIDIVVIYCASWSCNGAKNYYRDLVERKINVDKVVDYVGSIHEWASYATRYPATFTFHSLDSDIRSQLLLSKVYEILQDTAHTYYIDNVMKDDYLKNNSVEGKTMFV
jgi:hypothetical protein